MIQKILFLGSKTIGLRVLKLLHEVSPGLLKAAVTMDDRLDSRTEYTAIQEFCQKAGLPLHIPQGRKQAEELITAERPDICFVAGWYWLFSEAILKLPKAGFVGIHHSLLPRFRGGAPVVWALINGEPKVGSSIFQFTPGMDDGPIWGQVSVPVAHDDAIGEVLPKLEQAMLDGLKGILPGMLQGTLAPVEQDHTQATYCSQRSPDDGWIDWNWTAERIHHFVRAQSRPYPGAFTWMDGKKLTILKARLFPDIYDGPPGQVVRILNSEVIVTCGDRGAVVVELVEHGDAVVPATQVIQSIRCKFASYARPALVEPVPG